jgi:UDP-glucose 4-epimerase
MAEPSILVTGARGFVGRHLMAARRDAGEAPVGQDRPGARVVAAAERDWPVHDLLLGSGAAEASRVLADLIAAGDHRAIVHLAGQSSAGRSFEDPAGTVRANLLGTLELLEALRLLRERGLDASLGDHM